MKRTIGLLLVLLLAGLYAGELRAQGAGTIARLGFGGRGIAMGNSQLADESGQASAWYNPALAAFTQRQYAALTLGILSQDRRLEFARYAMPLRPRAGVTVGLIHTGVTGIDGRDGSGFHTETLSTSEFAGFLAFGIRFSQKGAAGLALRFYHNSLHAQLAAARTLGLSVGGLYRLHPRLTWGLVVDDLLARYSWDGIGGGARTSDPFPLRVRTGLQLRLADDRGLLHVEYESRFRTAETRTYRVYLFGSTPVNALEVTRLRLHDRRFAFGAEYRLRSAFVVRGGLDQVASGGLSGMIPSIGFGVEKETGDIRIQAAVTVLKEAYANGWASFVSVLFFL